MTAAIEILLKNIVYNFLLPNLKKKCFCKIYTIYFKFNRFFCFVLLYFLRSVCPPLHHLNI